MPQAPCKVLQLPLSCLLLQPRKRLYCIRCVFYGLKVKEQRGLINCTVLPTVFRNWYARALGFNRGKQDLLIFQNFRSTSATRTSTIKLWYFPATSEDADQATS